MNTAVSTAIGLTACSLPSATNAQSSETAAPETPSKTIGVVEVTGSRPTSLPTQIPTTMESTTRKEIQRHINATDSEAT
jgi:iron complex outermembrane receptor protein